MTTPLALYHAILSFPYLIAVYDESDYPIREENGASWRPFWWYNANGGGLPPPLALCHPILSFSNLIAVYEETDYPMREKDGASRRPFWWYNAN